MRELRRNFPLRLALVTAAIQTVLLLAILAAVYTGSAWLMSRALDETLAGLARAGVGAPGVPPDPVLVRQAMARGVAFATYRVDEHDREHRWERLEGPDWILALIPDDHALRVAYVRVEAGGESRVVAAAGMVGALAEELRELASALGLLALLGVVATAGLLFWLSRRAFQPLREMATTLAAVQPRDLGTRLALEVRDATVDRLVGTINGMLTRLEAAFRSQIRFAADAAHELRTPLGVLRADLEVALRHPRSPDEYRQVLSSALEEVERMARLSEDLLLLARQEGGAPLEVEPVRLQELVQRVQREAGTEAAAAGVDLLATTDPDLQLTCDAIAVERALVNLVRNGIQHTPAGGRVQISAIPAPGLGGEPGVRLEVADTGSGIPPDQLPYIFEPFYRADPARRRGGTGLGLAIVRSIAEAHRGQAGVESRPGKGSRFWLWLPV